MTADQALRKARELYGPRASVGYTPYERVTRRGEDGEKIRDEKGKVKWFDGRANNMPCTIYDGTGFGAGGVTWEQCFRIGAKALGPKNAKVNKALSTF